MYRNDFKAMCTEVYKHQHIETGGNLFGLWTTSGSAVIRVVLGPGQDCKRTNTSFHQDSEYMARVGRFVNEEHMLCHIGEWRSHHSLILDKPGAEDEITIRRNFPRGMSKFLFIIANIKNGDSVLSPYFFTDGGTCYEKAEFVILESKNPFSSDARILANIERGAEGNQGRASLIDSELPRNTGSDFHQNRNASPTYSQVASRSSHENPRQTDSITQRDGNTSSPHSQAMSTNGQPFGDNASFVTSIETSDTESPKGGLTPPAGHISAQTSDNPPENSTIQNQTTTTEDKKATTKEIIKDTYDELEKFFGQGNVEIERTSHGDINMIFEHESYHWMVRFPKTFPNQPAMLYRASNRHHSSSISPCPHYNLEKPLTNHVNILLSIKKNCRLTCKICENIRKENLTPEGGPTPPGDHTAQTTDNPPENGSAQNQTVKEITMKDIHDELEKCFGQGKVEIERSYDDINMIFEHESYHWMVRFPEHFPDQPAKLYRELTRDYFQSSSSGLLYNLEKPLTNHVNILLSIKKNCLSVSCKICKEISKEKLTKPAAAMPPVTTTFADVVKELANEIKMTDMPTPLSFSDRTQNDGSHKIEFEHFYKTWSIKIPAEFPEKPAEVYKQERPYGTPEKKTITDSSKSKHEQKSLVSSDLIMLAIRSNCYCSSCWNNSSCKQLRN